LKKLKFWKLEIKNLKFEIWKYVVWNLKIYSLKHIMFWKQNFHNINSIKSFLIFPAGSLFSRFLRIATVIRTRAFWYFQPSVATPLWPSVGVKPNTPKVGDLESSKTPECLESDSKAQNTSHWGVLGVIGKVLKLRYRKWPRIGHLDICSPSYGQFDSQPLKVGNRPLPNLRIESATWRWKDLDEGYNFGSDLVAIGLCSWELWAPKVPRLQPGQFWDNFGTPTWESREKEPFGCSFRGVTQRILHGGRWWLPPSPGHGEFCVSKCPWLVPTPKGVPECELTTL